jgi:PKD repeat protein
MPGFDYATMDEVIGVGATDAADFRSAYSNYGGFLDVVAPSGADAEQEILGLNLPGLVTTDVTDSAGGATNGYNSGGFCLPPVCGPDAVPDLPNSKYHLFFSGTSGACPVASGVAALVVGINPILTARQVRVIMEHTAQKVSPMDAQYDAVTSRSLRYGYGRVNAHLAAMAAKDSTTNGGFTWPEPPGNISVMNNRLSWSFGDQDTDKVMVVESNAVIQWIPTDDTLYMVGQEVQTGVFVRKISLNDPGDQFFQFAQTTGTTYFGLFAIGKTLPPPPPPAPPPPIRYSFGVLVNSQGVVVGAGPSAGGAGSTPVTIAPSMPAVTITANPLFGNSPLTVQFHGNALTDSPITSVRWDFDDGTMSDTATVTHTYTVTNGTTQRFIATFTVTDSDSDSSSRSIAIDVTDTSNAGGGGGTNEPPPDSSVRIVVGTPGTVGSNVDSGVAPFTAELSLDTSNLQGSLTSVSWDLGDGTRATSLSVLHVFTAPGIYPITATVTTQTNPSTTMQVTTTRLITVEPGLAGNGNVNRNSGFRLPPASTGGGAPCGVGMLALFASLAGLALMRRRW